MSFVRNRRARASDRITQDTFEDALRTHEKITLEDQGEDVEISIGVGDLLHISVLDQWNRNAKQLLKRVEDFVRRAMPLVDEAAQRPSTATRKIGKRRRKRKGERRMKKGKRG
jgi:hypothetical protein